MSSKPEARAVTVVAAVLAASTFIIPLFPTVEAWVTGFFGALLAAGILFFAFIVIRDLYL